MGLVWSPCYLFFFHVSFLNKFGFVGKGSIPSLVPIVCTLGYYLLVWIQNLPASTPGRQVNN